MIVLRFNGGLGNQLYQYALYRFLVEKYPEMDIKVDVTDYVAKSYHQGFEIEKIFNGISLTKATRKEIFDITGRLPVFYGGPGKEKVVKLRRKINRKFFNKWNGNVIWGKDLREILNDAEKLDELFAKEFTYIDRFFANPTHLSNIEMVAKELQFIPYDDANTEVANKIAKTNAVSIHVRRGDYVGTAYDVVTESYYREAIAFIEEKVDNPTYFIFSDDKDYAEKIFLNLTNKVVVNNNTGKSSFRDMQLMSQCKHNIIANSTFSEWGALMNNNENKIVIYPITPKMVLENVRIQLKGWISIEC